MSEALALDVWHPLDDEALLLSGVSGFQWRGLSPYGPFDRSHDAEFRTGLLPVDRVVVPEQIAAWNVSWREDHFLAALYDVWFGAPAANLEESDDARALPLDSNWLESDPFAQSPIAMTAAHLEYTGEQLGVIVVIVGDDPADLLRLWNLRAMGGRVHPWVVGRRGESAQAIESWLQTSGVGEQARVWKSGDGSTSGRLADISSGAHGEEASHVQELLEQVGFRTFVHETSEIWGWHGHHPMQTSEERSFSVQLTNQDWRVDLPLPELPLVGNRSRWPGIVVADISVHRESRLPPGRTLTMPAIRDLAVVIDSLTQDIEPFHRPTGEGRAIAVQAAAESVTVSLVPTLRVFERLFRETAAVGQSDEGRFATQFIDRLGGVDSGAASQPAVRQVLYDISKAARSRPIAALIEAAERSRGAWPGAIARQQPRDYAKSVVYWLAAAKLLLPTLSVRCPTCASETDVRAEDLANDMQCDLCRADLNLGLALALQGSANPWRYRLAGNLPPPRVRSGLAVMATNTVLMSGHRAGASPVMPNVLGLTLSSEGWSCEIDVAALIVDGPVTVAIVGEVKGGRETVNQVDIDNLTRVQMILREGGVETLIVVGTTRAQLESAEISILRAACESAPLRLRHGHRPPEPALPIVLCGADLSWPWLDDQHPWRWSQTGDLPLSGLALESCRRNLRLSNMSSDPSKREAWNLTWEPPPPVS